MELASINERLSNSKISKMEKGIYQIFPELLKSFVLDKASVLSLSCGDGIWEYLALKEGISTSKIIATDIVDCPVSEADQSLLCSYTDWSFRKLVLDSVLPFGDDGFDLCYHFDVIEHTEKPFLMVREQYRILKKGGHIVIGTPNVFRPANMLKALFGKLKFPIKIGFAEEIGDYIHVQEFHEAQLLLLAKECGFKNIKVHHVFFGFSWLNICFSMFPLSQVGKTFCHYLLLTAEK